MKDFLNVIIGIVIYLIALPLLMIILFNIGNILGYLFLITVVIAFAVGIVNKVRKVHNG